VPSDTGLTMRLTSWKEKSNTERIPPLVPHYSLGRELGTKLPEYPREPRIRREGMSCGFWTENWRVVLTGIVWSPDFPHHGLARSD
jgi:hypothetical protein